METESLTPPEEHPKTSGKPGRAGSTIFMDIQLSTTREKINQKTRV
jgi:hypothetical protein